MKSVNSFDNTNYLKGQKFGIKVPNDIVYNFNNDYLQKELDIKAMRDKLDDSCTRFITPEILDKYKKLPLYRKYIYEKVLPKDVIKKKYNFDSSRHNLSNVFNLDFTNNVKYFETDQLDILEETAENLRVRIPKYPVRLIKGILTKQNILLLNNSKELDNNIILSYKLNNSDITEKIGQPEQF
jgi:hypothetical protein